MKKKLLVIEPHSDDSLIAAGGFLLKYKDVFEFNFCLVTASDLNLRHGFVSRETRIAEYEAFVKRIGGKFIRNEVFPLNWESKLDLYGRAQLVRGVEEIVTSVDPEVIMTMGPSFHHDHTALYEAVIAAIRPTVIRNVKRVLLMENATYVHQMYDFQKPTTYVEITKEQLEEKIEIYEKIFQSQSDNARNALSENGIRKWAVYRGLEARTDYAEALIEFKNVI
jgi:LmbE family N-acetylglucosaminyl deacetylase